VVIAIFKQFLVVTNTVVEMSETKVKKSKNIKKEIEDDIHDDELTRLDRLKTGRRNFS